jgi:hypothetical protein
MPTPKVNSWLGWRIFTVNTSCRPYLGVDSTHLTGKYDGQLAEQQQLMGIIIGCIQWHMRFFTRRQKWWLDLGFEKIEESNWYSTWTHNPHWCLQRFRDNSPHYKKCCSLWRATFVMNHRKFVIKQHLWRKLRRSCIERHGSLLVTSLSFRHRLTWSMTLWNHHRIV